MMRESFTLFNKRGEKIEFPAWGLGLYGASGAYRPEDNLTSDQLLPLVEAAIEHGPIVIDTAAIYGDKPGEAECRLGEVIRVLTEKGKFNPEIHFVSTKCGLEFIEGELKAENSSERMRASAEKSCHNLGVKHLGILWLHRRNINTPVEEIADGMVDLIKQGIVLNVGLSEVGVETACAFQKALAGHGLANHFAGIQGEFSLVNQQERDVVDFCQQNKVPFFAYGVLAHGFLTESVALCAEGVRPIFFPQFAEGNWSNNLQLRQALEVFAKQKKCTLPQLCLAWAKAQGVVSLIGTTKVVHLQSNLEAMKMSLTPADLETIEQIRKEHPVCGERACEMLANFAPELF